MLSTASAEYRRVSVTAWEYLVFSLLRGGDSSCPLAYCVFAPCWKITWGWDEFFFLCFMFELYFAPVIVPFYGESEVFVCFFVNCDVVILFEYANQICCISFSCEYDCKVVEDQCGADRSGVMLPKARDDFVLLIAMFSKPLFVKNLAIMPAWGKPYIPFSILRYISICCGYLV